LYPNDYVKDLVKNIPYLPGVYQMKDENGNTIYVGKAISLKKRVRQYFQKNNKSRRIEKMVTLIRDIEYIVTKNEAEALALECNYIKEKNPKFNVMLKDDKTYPYLKITIKDKYPTIYITRRKIKDGNLYFGPYTDVYSLKETFRLIKEIFPIKRCKINVEKKKTNPCLYYHIGRCIGPCKDNVDELEYRNIINQIIDFLNGKRNDLKKGIIEEINNLVEKLEFEKAGMLKNRLEAIEKIYEKQEVSNLNEFNSDIIGYVLNNDKLYVQIFKIRDYKIVLNDNFVLSDILESEVEESIIELICRYYTSNDNSPKKVYVVLNDENILLIKDFLKIKNLKFDVLTPKKGQKLNLIKMVENNIKINIESQKTNAISELSDVLNIPDIDSIECYDISNLRNDYIVGCMIRFENGKLEKSKYRKFKIKSTLKQDDPKCMAEVLKRRILRKNEWPLPDLILLDGGKNQINSVKEILKELGEEIIMYGMVKNDKHRTRALMDVNLNEINIEKNTKVFNFITFLQDEIHRFTISYHRSLRDKIKE